MHRPVRPFAALAVAVCVAALSAPAQAADPVAFNAASFDCATQSHLGYRMPPVSAAHPDVMARVASNVAEASWYPNEYGAHDYWLAGPDVMWVDGFSAVDPSDEGRTGSFDCRQNPGSYTIEMFDVPTAPTSFAGASTPQSFGSTLAFNAPAKGRYAAAVTLSQGAVAVRPNRGNDRTIIASSMTYQVGVLDVGLHQLELWALDGPQARWNVRIYPLPVIVSAVTASRPVIAPGTVTALSYTLDADAKVTAEVLNAAGKVVRPLAYDLAVTAGAHTLPWNGRELSGAAVREGWYTLRLAATGADGQSVIERTKVGVFRTRRCGTVAITPRSGNALASVTARGISCVNARQRLRTWGKRRYRPRTGPTGFRCNTTRVYRAGNTRVACTRSSDGATVQFTTGA